MDKTHRGAVLTFTVLGGLGGLACILQWLGIKPGDLQMTATIPHWLWLVCGLLLFGVSISLSILSWRSSGKSIAEAIAPEKEEIKRLEAALHDSARSSLEYRAERDHCEEEKRVLQKRFDDMFMPLQLDALQLSTDLLEFLKRIGPAPAPKYSRDQIFAMSSDESRRLIEAQDGDFSEACAFHQGDNRIFPITGETLYRGIAHRHTRLVPWYEKLRASYALEFKTRVEEIHNRFAVEGFSDAGLLLEVQCFDGLKNVRSIAALLWTIAYKLKEKNADQTI